MTLFVEVLTKLEFNWNDWISRYFYWEYLFRFSTCLKCGSLSHLVYLNVWSLLDRVLWTIFCKFLLRINLLQSFLSLLLEILSNLLGFLYQQTSVFSLPDQSFYLFFELNIFLSAVPMIFMECTVFAFWSFI